MVTIVEGNLLQAKEDIIAHQVNCKGAMGAGLAKQIRDQYSVVYEKYVMLCARNRYNLLGACQAIEVVHGKFVANLFGQQGYGRNRTHTDYNALHSSLMQLRDFAEDRKLRVALPYGLGCGLAGGNWQKVLGLIESVFEDSSVDVTIYKWEEK